MEYTFDALELILETIPNELGIHSKDIKAIYHDDDVQPIFNGNAQTDIQFKIAHDKIYILQNEILVLHGNNELSTVSVKLKEIEKEPNPYNFVIGGNHIQKREGYTSDKPFDKEYTNKFDKMLAKYDELIKLKITNTPTLLNIEHEFDNIRDEIDEQQYGLENTSIVKFSESNPDSVNLTLPIEVIDKNFAFFSENGWTVKKSSCSHEWKEYNGFTKSYQFCSKCDEKRT